MCRLFRDEFRESSLFLAVIGLINVLNTDGIITVFVSDLTSVAKNVDRFAGTILASSGAKSRLPRTNCPRMVRFSKTNQAVRSIISRAREFRCSRRGGCHQSAILMLIVTEGQATAAREFGVELWKPPLHDPDRDSDDLPTVFGDELLATTDTTRR